MSGTETSLISSEGKTLKAFDATRLLGMFSFRWTPISGWRCGPLLMLILLVVGSGGSVPATADSPAVPVTVPAVSENPEDSQESDSEASSALVRVGIYDSSEGISQGVKALRKFLVEDAGFVCRRLTPQEIQTGALTEIDVLIMPGGSGSAQAKNLGEAGSQAVRQFVRDGGGYVGICAGSYLASSYYSWSLHLINAQVVDREHWARGTGTAILRLSEVGKQSLREPADEVQVYYGQGPLLAPDTKDDLPAYEVLAEYASEIAKKGAPTGVMIGTTAIARSVYGRGRVICYSPHPEVAEGPNHLMIHGVRWAAGKDFVTGEAADAAQ